MRRTLLAFILALAAAAAPAEELIMARSARPFAETMNLLGAAIADHGYRIQRIQRVDVGLSSSGFPTAEYRIVFFGKPDELNTLAASHPPLLTHMPLRITIFAEGDSSVLVATNPALLGTYFRDDALRNTFLHWETDVRSIMEQTAR